jgi:MtN3 and saliva related transmembrane protein
MSNGKPDPGARHSRREGPAICLQLLPILARAEPAGRAEGWAERAEGDLAQRDALPAALWRSRSARAGMPLARFRGVAIELIGWGSSLVLFATLTKQIWQQWQARDTGGVSPWLFIGQMTASLGFTTYSALIGNWVFVVTNVVLALAALVGLVVLMLHGKGERS